MYSTERSNDDHIDLDETAEGDRLDFTTFLDEAISDVKSLVHAQKKLIMMEAADKAATLSAKLIQSVVTAFAALFVLLFLNIALAFYLGELLDSTPLGFVCAAGLYAVIAVVFNLYWKNGGRDSFVIERINDFTDGE